MILPPARFGLPPLPQRLSRPDQVFCRCPRPGRNAELAWASSDTEISGRTIAIETRGEGTRRVWVSAGAYQTDEAWVVRQVESFLDHARRSGLPVGLVLRDRGSTFYPTFDRALEAAGAKVQRLAFRAPNTNAYVERFVQAIQQECLDKFIAFGPEHMNHLIAEYVEHYHGERPHQGKGNRPLIDHAGESPPAEGAVVCRERLGGVLRHYYRDAAYREDRAPFQAPFSASRARATAASAASGRRARRSTA